MCVGMARLKPVAVGKLDDLLRRQRLETAVADLLPERLAIAVARLEAAEEQHQPLEVFDREQIIDVGQRMRHAVR